MDAFYSSLVPPGALCFDIGANVGNRLASFRRLGFRVVALEPQQRCYAALQSAFGRDPAVVLINKAVGPAPGKATMMVSDADVLSTLSPAFIEATQNSGRFTDYKWDRTEEVDVVTFDSLIEDYGAPAFAKIDVEGFEREVLQGLTRPLPLVSIEWTPELTDNTLACIAHLAALGPVEFNLSWGESLRLARRSWLDRRSLEATLESFREETYLFGDVYIRSVARDR